jgi:hypothetical protein
MNVKKHKNLSRFFLGENVSSKENPNIYNFLQEKNKILNCCS